MSYLLEVKGNKPGSVDDVMYRLGTFFTEVDEKKGRWSGISAA